MFYIKESPAGTVGPGTGDIATPPVRLSVRPSVRHVQFSHCNSKTPCCNFSKLCWYVHQLDQVMSVCCIVFDIDGIFYDFLKY